jgi:2-methylisocitrate lyase-like PEP mutase family enzyme
VRAAVEAARALPFPFVVTARAENYIRGGTQDLAGVIGRLHAFAEAGADVLYAPGLPDADAIASVCAEAGRPVNALAGPDWSVARLAELGVRRISLGSALARVALAAFARAATEVAEHGTFGFATQAPSFDRINQLMGL